MNIGIVIVGLLDYDKAKEALRLPEGYEVIALIPLGWPAQEAKSLNPER